MDSLWCVGHGETDEVSAGQREKNHDGSESTVVGEVNRKEGATLDIAEHQQRNEHHPGDNQHREQTGLLTRLERETETEGIRGEK